MSRSSRETISTTRILADQAFSRAAGAPLVPGSSVRLLKDAQRQLRQAGVEVRRFNPLRFDSPFGWLSRDHRKMLSVDGRIAFVSGLCVGRRWVGYPERGIEWVAAALLVRPYRLRRDRDKPAKEFSTDEARQSQPPLGNNAIRQERNH
jgi:hypothetical protein